MRAESFPPATVAYVIKAFPRATETFIAHEIRELEALGLPIRIYSIKPGEHALTHEVLTQIRAEVVELPRTSALTDTPLWGWLAAHWPLFRSAHARLLKQVPGRYARTLIRALWMCWRHRKAHSLWPRKVYLKEFLQAGLIADDILRHPEVGHLHGHFCHGATTVTWFVSQLTGHGFSFTAHAKDIYEPHLNPRDLLPKKISAARFIATCTEVNRRHLAALPVQTGHVHTIYHGLDPDYFCPAGAPALSAEDTPPLLLAVGRIIEKKGFRDLAHACALLRARGLRFRCEIIGEPGDAASDLTATAQHLGLDDDWFRLCPPLPQQQLRERYRAATVFVLPCLITGSGDRDGIPNVLAEAMASGLPVVSTRISGIPELVRDRVDGLLVRDRDPQALADVLAKLLSNPSLCRALGASARHRICTMFDSRATTLTLYHLLHDAVQPQAEVTA